MFTVSSIDVQKIDRQKQWVHGYSAVELIVVIAIFFLIAAVAVLGFSSYAKRQGFEQFVNEITFSIKEQRQRTLASNNDTQYGVYVGTTTIDFFTGTTYTPGAVDVSFSIPSDMTATSSFSSGNWYVSFARLTGAASATGTIVFIDRDQNTATVTISALGLVE